MIIFLFGGVHLKKILQANAAKIPSQGKKLTKNFMSKSALSASAYMLHRYPELFSLNMSHILCDLELERDDKISHFCNSQTNPIFFLYLERKSYSWRKEKFCCPFPGEVELITLTCISVSSIKHKFTARTFIRILFVLSSAFWEETEN